jgi:hypothetical protein
MSPEDEAEVAAQMRAARVRARGHADFFGWPINRDLEEWGVVKALSESLLADGALFFSKLQSRGRQNDPPDCEALDGSGHRLAVEVTELVDPEAIKAYKRGAIYEWSEWERDRFIDGLATAVAAKDQRFVSLKDVPYEGGYVLVVHTDEPFLRFDTVTTFLSGHVFRGVKHLTRGFLLCSYDPTKNRCPYVELELSG